MKKNLLSLIGIMVGICCTAPAWAVPVNDYQQFNAENLSVGNTIRFKQAASGEERSDRDLSKGGGEFNVYKAIGGSYEFLYQSFCLERNETIGFNTDYTVVSISDRAEKGGKGVTGYDANDPNGVLNSYDPISLYTEYLFHNFYYGSLNGYVYDGAGDQTSARDLQFAIWYFEDELQDGEKIWGQANPGFDASANSFISDAVTFVSNNQGWQGYGDVKVMNIVDTSNPNNYRQSQLIVDPIPEPATMLLFGTGLAGLGAVMRRRKR